MKTEILLGQKVRDKVTGFTGIVDHIGEYMFQCRSIGVRPKLNKDGTMADIEMIDEPQLEIVDKKPIMVVKLTPHIYEIGQEAEDTITGYTGTIVARAYYLNGCNRVALQPKYSAANKDSKLNSGTWFSENQIKSVGKLLKKKVEEKKPGGPAPSFNDSRIR